MVGKAPSISRPVWEDGVGLCVEDFPVSGLAHSECPVAEYYHLCLLCWGHGGWAEQLACGYVSETPDTVYSVGVCVCHCDC